MRILFFRLLFITVFSIVFAITIAPDNPSIYNHYLTKKVFFKTEDGSVDIPQEIKDRVQFLREEERFYSDYLVSDISNLIKSGLVKDVNVRVRAVDVSEVNVYFELILNQMIEKVQFSNVSVFTPEMLSVSLNNISGKRMDYSKIKEDVRIIENKYEKKGYVLARVSNVFFVDQYSTIIFNVEEGEIARVILKGADKINHHLVLREMGLVPGSVLNMNKLREDRLAVLKLGYFSRVSVPSIVPSLEFPGKVDVIYEVTESKINNLQIGLEQLPNNLYSLTLGLRLPNFRNQGDGIYLKAQTLVRGILEDYNYYLKYEEPWPFGVKMPFNFILWYQVNKENVLGTSSSVAVKRSGWESILQPVNFDDKKLLVGYSQEDVEDTSGTYAPYQTNAVRVAFIQNSITNINHPTKGAMLSVEVEKGNNLLGIIRFGGIDYAKYELKYSIFQEVFFGGVLGFHFETGLLDSDDGTIFLFEQDIFTVGGAYSLRGYKDPYADPSSAISGTKKALINLEYRRLILDWVQFAVFSDWGYATSGDLAFSEFKLGGGMGVRFFTPLVPVRLDFGYSEQEGFILHFGLGQVF